MGSTHERLYCSNIINLPISDLLPPDSPPRTGGVSASHIRILAESTTALPAIVVHRATMQVVDGWHRLRAAQLRGEKIIAAVLFEGSRAEAFVLAVKLNTAHGLPLSLADRKAAALRILSSYPAWSDRVIASIAGISPKTVAALRGPSTEEFPQSTGRIARNGVLHRSINRAGRERAAELFAADSNASAPEVALAAGISVTTAKDVRKRLRAGEQPVPPRRSGANPTAVPESVHQPARNAQQPSAVHGIDAAEILQRLHRDPSLRFNETGRRLLRWLEIPFEDSVDFDTIARNLPSHCVHMVAELARQRSRDWQHLARLLDQRS
nr:ParB/RepB/Spo0J family partition protein [Nocardia panacis]